MRSFVILGVVNLASLAIAGYNVKEDFMDGNFFDHFDFVNSPDPTHGFVNYVDGKTAAARQYINTANGAYIGVDSVNIASDAGRDSVRLASKSSFDESLIVLDLAHMPTGMGTWPAFWTFGPNWPNSGEIDIIEGVNDQAANFMTIHSGNSACKMESKGLSTLQPHSTDCYAQNNGNEGCSYHDTDSTSYGSAFNQAQGGIFAMEYTGHTVSIWRWNNGASPSDILSANPNPSTWGPPRAQWLSTANGDCDLKKAIRNQAILFDTTFCGDWAGAVFPGSSGSGSAYPNTCSDFVKHNPSSFSNAFWQVRSLKVYTTDGKATVASSLPPPPPPPPTSTSTTATQSTAQAPPPPPPTSTSTTATQSTTQAPPPPPPVLSKTTTTTSTSSAVTTTASSSITTTASNDTASISTTTTIVTSSASSTTDSIASSSSSAISQQPMLSSSTSSASTTFTQSISSATSIDSLPSSTSSVSATTESIASTTSTASFSSFSNSTSITATSTMARLHRGSCPRHSSGDAPYPTGIPSSSNSTISQSTSPSSTSDSSTSSITLSATPIAAFKTVETNSPWSVVVTPDGQIREFQEPQANIKRNVLRRRYHRHGHDRRSTR